MSRGQVGRLAAVLATLCVAPAHASAQSVTVSMTADRTQVQVGEQLEVQIRADVSGADVSNVEPPDLSAFRVVGQTVARPMQFRFGAGNRQQIIQSTTVYSYRLQAVSEGRFEIGPAKVYAAGRSYTSNGLTLVVGAGGGGATPGVPPAQPPAGPLDGAVFDAQAFVRTVVDRSSPWVGQQATVTVYLYTRTQVRSSPVIHREPTADGFWVHDLLSPARTLEPQRQVVSGLPYNVYVLRRFAAFPLRSGPLTIGALELSFDTGSVLDLFNPQIATVRRAGVPVTIDVKPLPEQGRPGGPIAVGTFELAARLDRTQVATGDAITLTATISGTGNVSDAQMTLPAIPGVRVLQPQIRDQVTAQGDLVGGTRTIEWLLVPERAGTYTFPDLALPTFDPVRGAYARVAAAPLTLVAAGNAIDSAGPDPTDTTSPDGTNPDSAEPLTLGPVRTRSDLARGVRPVTDSPWFSVALALPPALWLALVLAGVIRRRLRARDGFAVAERAVRVARRRLGKARTLASNGDARGFYGEVSQVLKEVLEVRLGEAVGGYTYSQLLGHLVSRGMEQDLASRLVDELEGLEFARFSVSGVETDEMGHCTRRVGALLERIDRFVPEAGEAAR